MERFDAVAADLVVGQTVRVEVLSHERWGVLVQVRGHETVGASVDALYIDSPSGSVRALEHEYPRVGAELDAVVVEVERYGPPGWLRLTLRAADLNEFRWVCGFCGRSTVLSPGGDGVSVDVRSADGPGAASFTAHRSCLIERLDPTFHGDRARVTRVGRD